MKNILLFNFIILISCCLFITGCPMNPPERDAYNTIVASKAFLNSFETSHPECGFVLTNGETTGLSTVQTSVCQKLNQAISAQHLLVDVVKVVCAGPTFNNGGPCNFPAKGTQAYQQAIDKLSSATNNYKFIADDLKGLK